MLGSLRSLLHSLRRDPATITAPNGGRRPHRSRFQRRLVRRMRRLGLLPRDAPSSSASQNTAAALLPSSVPDAQPMLFSGEENTTSGQQEEQAPPLPQKVLPTPTEPVPEPWVLPPPPTPRFSGMMHTLRVRLFSPAAPCAAEVGNPHSTPTSPEDEDDVLLMPLAEPRFQSANEAAAWDPDDEPLLT